MSCLKTNILSVTCLCIAHSLDNGLALTPVLGWSSWYSLNDTLLNETAVKQNLEILVLSGMVDSGYKIMILDDGWEAPARDSMGYLNGNPKLFPNGIKALADTLREYGVGLGLYTTPGNHTCLNHPASYGHIAQDVGLWVNEWGIVYMKDCMCNTTKELRAHAYAEMQKALNTSNKDVIFECDPPPSDDMWSALERTCNLWGAHDDIYDTFGGWTQALDNMESWKLAGYAHPGAWNLPDILRLGEGGQTYIEYQAQMGIYAILASPLIVGTDLRFAKKEYLEMYTAPEVLEMDQDPLGMQGKRVLYTNGVDVFRRDLTDDDIGVHVLNRGGASVTYTLPLSVILDVNPRREVRVRNVWTRQDIGIIHTSESLVLVLDKHQGLLLRFSF